MGLPRVVRVVSVGAAAAAALTFPAAAGASHIQDPPVVSLTSQAGYQRAAQESFCVFAPPHDGEEYGVRRCVDTVDMPPRRLSVVRPGGIVTIRFGSAKVVSEASVLVRRLGRERYIGRRTLTGPSTRWRIGLRPGAYELQVFGRFEMEDGRIGDTSGSLGLLVSRTHPLQLVPLSAAR